MAARGGGVTGGWLLQCPEPGKKEVPRDGGAVAGAGHSFDYLLTALSPSSPGWAAPGHQHPAQVIASSSPGPLPRKLRKELNGQWKGATSQVLCGQVGTQPHSAELCQE